ncbi:ABC transporter ATP-binding protein [Candidatus Nitrospira neomarina]|uniref:ABC transporter ATP-binding protein n=1 Tax=Candidatus Nitrospira neomarina TaxID=3020899 RepID=A0AA96GIP0_9BACT|nr:ABC transporter ATP-binding protein [Candidatus Nitrospira neomarina]WNM62047.1 ABC transporter ATP-binding protein [Candidatus Nitrospira neomarina]
MSSKSLFTKPSIFSRDKSRGEEAQPPYLLSQEYKTAGVSGQTVQEANDVAIRVQNLCKCYQIYDQPQDRLKQWIYPRLQRFVGRPSKQYFCGFWALKEVSFEVKKGETVGIIGRNGSGKSTLLQMICGTLTPTSGSIFTYGRIAALLELGSGFNAEFTGRENVYMNAAVLGLSRAETDARIDDIIAFADIGDFIEQPVKMYSSGMMVRLAFAVQSQVAPAILIVDEALAVGDAKFQAKCFDRLKKLKDSGTSILLVTHSSEQIVTHCTKALLLENGMVLESGQPRVVVNRYMDLLFGKEKKSPDAEPIVAATTAANEAANLRCSLSYTEDVFATRPGYNPHEYRWGDGSASILDFYLSADGDMYPYAISTGQTVHLGVSFRFSSSLVRPILGITIKTKEGVTIYGANSETLEAKEFKSLGQHGQVAYAKAVFCCRLAPGDYFLSLGIATKQGEVDTPHDRRYDAIHFQVRPETKFFGLVDLGLHLTAQEIAL